MRRRPRMARRAGGMPAPEPSMAGHTRGSKSCAFSRQAELCLMGGAVTPNTTARSKAVNSRAREANRSSAPDAIRWLVVRKRAMVSRQASLGGYASSYLGWDLICQSGRTSEVGSYANPARATKRTRAMSLFMHTNMEHVPRGHGSGPGPARQSTRRLNVGANRK